jgi:hypothetical protein
LQNYTAWCGVKYTDQFQRETGKIGYSEAFMEEHVEIDRDGHYEKIEVPKFDVCSDAVILHDFFKVRLFVANIDVLQMSFI